ncbi:hypothetical protein QBZ16_000005 [Prototheca wickerhamii]|uniref:RBR-type E3 ubiquitin transferase n=1 Tax=Prototheca wickerhamii TaxID=3111 RepID=A0AAD9IP08_PROWI|nr:hypothetical protein QBZ16_000005 [Prototheca wickerhamii]
MLKNSTESGNMTWILANTKPCPQCKRPIEKNQGCMHMTFQELKDSGKLSAIESEREKARLSLERYMHYWQRWAENNRAKEQALGQLQRFLEQQQESLSELTATPSSQLRFVEDAWDQVIDCRRVLKWTYAEGYYKFAVQSQTAQSQQHEEFFVFNQQGQAESYLEKLHHKVEKDLQRFLTFQPGPDVHEKWTVFREQLIGLTDVTRTHFQKLVDEMEKGLDAALISASPSLDGAEERTPGSSKRSRSRSRRADLLAN